MSRKEQSIGEVAALTFQQIADFIEAGELTQGTSASAAMCQVEIDGVWYELQLRLESSPKSFIGADAVVQTHQVGATNTMS